MGVSKAREKKRGANYQETTETLTGQSLVKYRRSKTQKLVDRNANGKVFNEH